MLEWGAVLDRAGPVCSTFSSFAAPASTAACAGSAFSAAAASAHAFKGPGSWNLVNSVQGLIQAGVGLIPQVFARGVLQDKGYVGVGLFGMLGDSGH